MTSFRGFTILLVTTVTLASSALEASRFGTIEPRLVFGLAMIYALTMWLREHIYKPETTFFDADHVQSEKEELLVFGHGIEDLAHESRERRVLMGLSNNLSGEHLKIYAIWIFSMALAVFVQTRFRSLTLTDAVVPVAILSAMCFSPFLAQLLLPLAMSLAVALIAIAKSDSLLVIFYFVLFAVSFFLTLFLYREVIPDRLNNERKTKLPTVLKSSFAVTVLFLGLYLAMDLIVPEENPFKSNPVPKTRKPSKRSTDKLSREIAEQVLKYQEKGRGESSADASGETPGGHSPGESPRGDAPGESLSGHGAPRSAREDQSRDGVTLPRDLPLSRDGGPPSRDSARSNDDARGGTGHANEKFIDVKPDDGNFPSPRDHPDQANGTAQTKDREGTGHAAERERNLGAGRRESGDGRAGAGRGKERSVGKTDGVADGVADGQSKNPGTGGGRDRGIGHTTGNRDSDKKGSTDKGDGYADGASVGTGDGTADGTSQQASDGKSEGPSDEASARASNKASDRGARKTSAGPKEKAAAREKKIEEIKKKVEMPIEIGKGILFLIAAAIGLPILFNLIARWKERPKDEVKLQQLSPRQKKKLQSILHQIRARGLAADAEVIETYNALLSVFEMGHHPRDEWLPAEDFSMKIAGTIPPLSAPFGAVTNRFSRTLYGRKLVAPEDLNVFRKEVGRILQFFQVN